MKLGRLVIATVFSFASATVPSANKLEYKPHTYSAPAYSETNNPRPVYAASYKHYEHIIDGSSKLKLASSEYTIREEIQQQNKLGDYGKEMKEGVYGNNMRSRYRISPNGEKFTLTWATDDAGFQHAGADLPVAPIHVYELPVAPVHEYELPVAPVHEYELPVAPVHEYELPVAPVHIPLKHNGAA